MKVIDNFSCLKEVLPLFNNYKCIVILAEYNYGKSSVCIDEIHHYFGEENTYYTTFIDQSKPGFAPRKSKLDFNEFVTNKIIIFDEIDDEKERNIREYIKQLIKNNRVVILSNPYGSSKNSQYECKLFKKHEKEILPKNTLFVYMVKQ